MLSVYNLHLHEEVVMLALHETRGTLPGTGAEAFAVSGGMLSELLLARRIRLEPVKRKVLVRVTDERLTGDHLVDECFERIRKSTKVRTVNTWISLFAQDRGRTARIINRLYMAGIMRREERSVLWLFTRHVYPLQSKEAKRRIVERLRAAVIDGSTPDPRTRALLGLSVQSGLVGNSFSKAELKLHKERIASLIAGDPIVAAVREARGQAHAAMHATPG